MCHPVLFGLLIGVLAAKLLRRFSSCRGGCGSRWEFRHGPFGRDFRGSYSSFAGARSVTRSIDELLLGLDLNKRQQEEAQPILDRLVERTGKSGPRLTAALSAVAAERFDRAQAERIFTDAPPEAGRELVDGLEHFHNILIPEQREHLRARLDGAGGPASL